MSKIYIIGFIFWAFISCSNNNSSKATPPNTTAAAVGSCTLDTDCTETQLCIHNTCTDPTASSCRTHAICTSPENPNCQGYSHGVPGKCSCSATVACPARNICLMNNCIAGRPLFFTSNTYQPGTAYSKAAITNSKGTFSSVADADAICNDEANEPGSLLQFRIQNPNRKWMALLGDIGTAMIVATTPPAPGRIVPDHISLSDTQNLYAHDINTGFWDILSTLPFGTMTTTNENTRLTPAMIPTENWWIGDVNDATANFKCSSSKTPNTAWSSNHPNLSGSTGSNGLFGEKPLPCNLFLKLVCIQIDA